LSGESRFRSMVRESSMELKPRCLYKVEGGFTARSAADESLGKVLSESLRRSRLFFRRFFSNRTSLYMMYYIIQCVDV
jgi:hypothetical protein